MINLDKEGFWLEDTRNTSDEIRGATVCLWGTEEIYLSVHKDETHSIGTFIKLNEFLLSADKIKEYIKQKDINRESFAIDDAM